jgi:hypothetical protein
MMEEGILRIFVHVFCIPIFQNHECLLELLRLGRNTVYNNGVYFPEKKGDNRHVTYKNISYDFTDGQNVWYGNLSKLPFFDIVSDMLT